MNNFDFNSKEYKVVKTTEVNGREAFVVQRKLRIEDIFSLDKRIGNEYVDGRELHEVLGYNTKYKQWMDNLIEKYGFEKDEDYLLRAEKVASNNPKNPYTTQTNHKLTAEMAKEIAMVQGNKIGQTVRKYFIQIEKDYIEYITGRKEFTEENRQESLQKVTVIQEGIVGTFAIGIANWQTDVDKVMKRLGGYETGLDRDKWKKVWNRAYKILEEQTGVNIQERLDRIQDEMLENGFSQAQVEKVNKISVVAKDIELIKTFTTIVQEMASKKKIEVTVH